MDDILLPSDEELLKEQKLIEQMDEPEYEYSLLSKTKSPSPEIIDPNDCEQPKSGDDVMVQEYVIGKEVVDDSSDKPSTDAESCEFLSITSDKSDMVMISSSDIPDVNSMGTVTTEPAEIVQEMPVKEEVSVPADGAVEEETESIPNVEEEPVVLEMVPQIKSAPVEEATPVEEAAHGREFDSAILAEEVISQVKELKEIEETAVPSEEHITIDDTAALEVVPQNDEATPTPEEVSIIEDPLEEATPTPPTISEETEVPVHVSSEQVSPIESVAPVEKSAPLQDNIKETEPPISPCEILFVPEEPATHEKTVETSAEATPELTLEPGKSNDDADDNLPDDIVGVEKEADIKEEDRDDVEKLKEDWLDVLGSGQLKKRTKVDGKGERMEKGDQVTIIYSLTLASGKEIDTNVEQTFQLGDGEVIQAIDLTANLAKVGEKYEVVSFSRFAYDILGRPPMIGSNCSVLLEVEIMRCEKTPKVEEMSEEERINVGDRKRKIGNDYFARNDFAGASRNYNGAIFYLDPPSYKVSNEPSDTLKDLQFKSWCNLAIAELKLSKIDPGLRAADKALEIQPDSTKAMYRKAKLLVEKGALAEAEKVLKKACELDPKSPGCNAFLKELTKKIATQKKKEKMMYQKMFSLGDKEGEGSGKKSSSSDDNSWTAGLFPMIATSVAVGSLAVVAYKMLQ